MTYWEILSASFFGNILSWVSMIIIAIPFVVMEYLSEKKNDNKNDDNKNE